MTISPQNRWSYLITPALFLVVSIVWSQLTYSTWDDDAATRFFATLRAGQNPQSFLDSWLRPLFVQLFYFPIYLFGRMGLVVTMSLLTAFSGILLYKGLAAKGVNNAYAVLFFHLTQTFLFGITRDALTEPLAAFILSLGCYFYFTEKWAWFAVAGSFLPLARTETVLLLPIWAFILLQRNKYTSIPLLGVGLSLLFLGWFVYSGNLQAFFDNNLATGAAPNRYARTTYGQYFWKLPYIVGPVTYLFMMLGYVVNVKRMFSDLFIMLQCTVGIFMITLFGAAEISLGQAAGFLRNALTFAPLMSVIALYGFNYWMEIFTTPKEGIAQDTDKKKSKVRKGTAAAAQKAIVMKKAVISGFLIMLLIVSANMLSQKLLYRQFYSEEEKDFSLLFILVAIAGVLFISFLGVSGRMLRLLLVLLLATQVSFTLYSERPDVNDNEERKALSAAAEWVLKNDLAGRGVYCNHLWFYWTLMCDQRLDLPQKRIDSATLRSMPPGSIVVWEPHYTNKNYSNIPLGMMTGDTSLVMIKYIQGSENNNLSFIFTKLGPGDKTKELFDQLAQKDPEDGVVMMMKGFYEKTKLKDLNASTKSFDRAIALQGNLSDAYFHRGENYLVQGQMDKACADLQIARTQGNKDAERLVNRYCLNIK